MRSTTPLYKTSLVVILAALVMAGVHLSSCHLDGLLLTPFLGQDHFRPPDAPDTTLVGQFETEPPFGLPGANIEFFMGDRSALGSLSASIDTSGQFSLVVPGTESYSNLILYASNGSSVLMGITPHIPAANSVYDNPRHIDLSLSAPAMAPIDDTATTIALLIEGKLRHMGLDLNVLTESAMLLAMDEVEFSLDREPFLTFRRMVTRLLTEASSQVSAQVPVFLPPNQILAAGSSLNPEFLTTHSTDYTGDGAFDTNIEAYEAALSAAMEDVEFAICYHPELIRVVFMVDFREGRVDGNCTEINRFRWLAPTTGATMFITGGIHEDAILCEDSPDYEYCITAQQAADANSALGSWVPNRVAMYDDGTHGDAVAGDGIWTRAFDLPIGARLNYKYTFGQPGSGWTGTEEWPGNSRLIELLDVSGNNMVIRYDNWGDETTNKDRSNSLLPSRGGVGSVTWDSDRNGDGFLDAREIPVDLTGNCDVDGWPAAGPNAPLVVDCEEN